MTHDQGEALSFADQVAIMHDGLFAQTGPPVQVYSEPVDRRSAEFLGEAQFLPGTVASDGVGTVLGTLALDGAAPSGPVDVLLRPEQLRLTSDGDGALATVVSTTYFGHDALVALDLDSDGRRILARVSGLEAPVEGTSVGVTVVGPVRAYASDGGDRAQAEATRPSA